MNRLWITLSSLIMAPLCAETAGNLNFQFPPSNYEWQLLINDTIFEDAIKVEGETSEEHVKETDTFKIFTHREGDALELFYAIDVAESEIKAKVIENLFQLPTGETTLVPFIEQQMNQLGFFFPNHKIVLLNLEVSDDNCLLSWACHDGVADIAHGQLRMFKTKQGFAMLHYMTTAQLDERNLVTWKDVLNQASVNQ